MNRLGGVGQGCPAPPLLSKGEGLMTADETAWMPLTTTDTAQAELEAMRQCLEALATLERHSQIRAARWLCARVESQVRDDG